MTHESTHCTLNNIINVIKELKYAMMNAEEKLVMNMRDDPVADPGGDSTPFFGLKNLGQ